MSTSHDRYKTILVMVAGLLVISLVIKSSTLLYVTAGIAVACALIPAIAKWTEFGWLKLAQGLGWINSRVLLTAIYFIFLLPIAWFSRLFTRDPLMIRKPKTSSLFVTRNHTYTKKDLENIW